MSASAVLNMSITSFLRVPIQLQHSDQAQVNKLTHEALYIEWFVFSDCLFKMKTFRRLYMAVHCLYEQSNRIVYPGPWPKHTDDMLRQQILKPCLWSPVNWSHRAVSEYVYTYWQLDEEWHLMHWVTSLFLVFFSYPLSVSSYNC